MLLAFVVLTATKNGFAIEIQESNSGRKDPNPIKNPSTPHPRPAPGADMRSAIVTVASSRKLLV